MIEYSTNLNNLYCNKSICPEHKNYISIKNVLHLIDTMPEDKICLVSCQYNNGIRIIKKKSNISRRTAKNLAKNIEISIEIKNGFLLLYDHNLRKKAEYCWKRHHSPLKINKLNQYAFETLRSNFEFEFDLLNHKIIALKTLKKKNNHYLFPEETNYLFKMVNDLGKSFNSQKTDAFLKMINYFGKD